MTDTMIGLDDIIRYCIQYDKLWGAFPESEWEGKAVIEDMLEYMVKEGRISQEQYNEIMNKLNEMELYDRNYI